MKCGLYSKLGELNPKMGFGEQNKALRKIPFLGEKERRKGEKS